MLISFSFEITDLVAVTTIFVLFVDEFLEERDHLGVVTSFGYHMAG